MPNWVYNQVTVGGKLSEVERFQQQAGRKYTRQYKHPGEEKVEMIETDQVLSFHNFLPTPDDDTYDWYDWNIANWDTKWDACRPMIGEIERHPDGYCLLEYEFDTAWGQPERVFQAMVEQFPALEFDISYNEEQGWGGHYSGKDGVLSHTEEWSIPESHEEKEQRNGQCHCEYMEDSETKYMFDDCPKKMALVSN
jgi:hypothetical protein